MENITVNPHKDGSPSQGCIIRNNISATIIATGDTVEDHNYLLSEDFQLFESPASMNYHLIRPNADVVIDLGSSLLAPDSDLDRNPRPVGNGIDMGCYEYSGP